jgi:hypothetical protein
MSGWSGQVGKPEVAGTAGTRPALRLKYMYNSAEVPVQQRACACRRGAWYKADQHITWVRGPRLLFVVCSAGLPAGPGCSTCTLAMVAWTRIPPRSIMPRHSSWHVGSLAHGRPANANTALEPHGWRLRLHARSRAIGGADIGVRQHEGVHGHRLL